VSSNIIAVSTILYSSTCFFFFFFFFFFACSSRPRAEAKAEVVQVPWMTFASGQNLPGFGKQRSAVLPRASAERSPPPSIHQETDSDPAPSAPGRYSQNFNLSFSASSGTESSGRGARGRKREKSSVEGRSTREEGAGVARKEDAAQGGGAPGVPPLPMKDPLSAPAVNSLAAPWKPAATRLSSLSYMCPGKRHDDARPASLNSVPLYEIGCTSTLHLEHNASGAALFALLLTTMSVPQCSMAVSEANSQCCRL